MLKHRRLYRSQQGVTLVESMIALLVISIGLLGIASLQITAISQNASALNHSKAVWTAYNLSDRVRANRPRFADYNDINTSGAPAQDCMANICSAEEMVISDAHGWKLMVEQLPGGLGLTTINVAQDALTITVMWDDDGKGATGTNCDPETKTENDLTCYRLVVTR